MIREIYFPQKNERGLDIREGNLPAILKHQGKFEFKEGLNILIGANGTGKTSIIKAIGNYMAADELGYSAVSHNWLASNRGVFDGFHFPVEVEHDGQRVFYGDPKRKKGYTAGGQSIEEFAIEGALEGMSANSESSGEQSLRRITPFLDLIDQEPEFLDIAVYSDQMEAYIRRNVEIAEDLEKIFCPKIPRGQPTILLDEPEAGLGILSSILFWKKIKRIAKEGKYQIILASHSEQCLNIEGANYIELTEGYRQACLSALENEDLDVDIKKKSFSVIEELTTYQKSAMRKMAESELITLKSPSEKLEKLIELKLVDYFKKKDPELEDAIKKEKESRSMRLTRRFNRDYGMVFCYHLTAKGKDYTREILNSKP